MGTPARSISTANVSRKKIVIDEPRPLKRNGVANAQTAPTHEHDENPDPSAVVTADILATTLSVQTGRIKQLFIFFAYEVIRRRLRDGNSPEPIRGVGRKPAGSNTKPEKSGQPFLLLFLSESTVGPRRPERLCSPQIKFFEELVSFSLAPTKELFFKLDLQLVKRSLRQLSRLRIGQVLGDGLNDCDWRIFALGGLYRLV